MNQSDICKQLDVVRHQAYTLLSKTIPNSDSLLKEQGLNCWEFIGTVSQPNKEIVPCDLR